MKRSCLGRLSAALLMALALAVLCVACGGEPPVTGPDVPDATAPSESVTEPAETPPTAGPVLPEATSPAATGPQETEPPETVPPETEPPETAPPETEPPETGPPETEPPETEPPATEPPETVPPETVPPETVSPETVPPETVPPETEPPETEPPETEPPETEPPVTVPPETVPPETVPPETVPPETEPVETTPPETEPPVETEKDENVPAFTVEKTEYTVVNSVYMSGTQTGVFGTIVPICSHTKSALPASSDDTNDAVYGKGNWYRTVADHYAFESSDESVVSVDENGEMTRVAVMRNGDTPKTAYVTVTHKADGTKLEIKVTITLEPYYDIDDAYIAAYAVEMLRLVNEARRGAGVPEVTYPTDPAYQEVVNERAKELAESYGHSFKIQELQRAHGLDDYFGRENIASGGYEKKGQTTLESPESVAQSFFKAWMSDNDHKGTILFKSSNEMVCGFYAVNSKCYVVQWFGNNADRDD